MKETTGRAVSTRGNSCSGNDQVGEREERLGGPGAVAVRDPPGKPTTLSPRDSSEEGVAVRRLAFVDVDPQDVNMGLDDRAASPLSGFPASPE